MEKDFKNQNKNEVVKHERRGLFDPFFEDFFSFPSFKHEFREMERAMKTDVREDEKGYSLEVELPGVDKNDVNLELNNGYLTIQAKQNSSNDEKDANGNVLIGNVIDENSKNSFAYSSSKLVATVGLEDTVIVETEDAILACRTDNTQDVKLIYERLKKMNNDAHKVHKTVYRPWGFYTVIAQGNGFLTKKIHVNPHQKLSLQSHNHRSEHWVVALGNATVRKGEETFDLTVGQSVDIAVGEKHSLQNLSNDDVEIIELQQGNILLEEDIVRYEDMYGRV